MKSELLYQLRYALPVWLLTLLTAPLPDNGLAIRIRGTLISIILPNRPRMLSIGRDVTLLSINRLTVGNSVYLAKGCWVNAIGGVTIEHEVVCAPYVVMSSNNHGFKEGSVVGGGAHPSPIVLGSGSWIAAHAVIGAGVSVGKGNLVAANSVVTKDTPENVVVGGVPARILSDRVDNPSVISSKHDFK